MTVPTLRPTEAILPAQAAIEGAGVHIRRAFGQQHVPRLDPFLLLDDLRSENPLEFAAGFPWHPHRGIETVTYMLDGRVEHEDSLGNKGVIGGGDVQWMTAGSGIVHQEMPKVEAKRLGGFQLWVNLPSKHKMMGPRYQEVKAPDIPTVQLGKGTSARVVAGEAGGVHGPVRDVMVDPLFLDVRLEKGARLEHAIPEGHRAFAYTLEGQAVYDPLRGDPVDANHLVVFRDGKSVRIDAPREKARFLLIAGKPLREPVAWWGPIVMNTRRELEEAVEQYSNGTFVKPRARAAV